MADNDSLRDWVRARAEALEEKILDIMRNKKGQILKSLEELEVEAGTQVMEEARRFVAFLGGQFVLESD